MEELEHSELGTQEYWDNRYQSEIANFQANGDIGDVWFEDIVDRIISWVVKNTSHSDLIIDVGCGNGMLLVDLAQLGFENLTGVDYSETAITLAQAIAKKQDLNIEYRVGNILENALETRKYKVVLDKGTYDAISLSTEAKQNRTAYIQNVHQTMKDAGLLVITSCNWTNEELEEQFQSYFQLFGTIPMPQFKFGGKVGSVVSSVVFKKKEM